MAFGTLSPHLDDTNVMGLRNIAFHYRLFCGGLEHGLRSDPGGPKMLITPPVPFQGFHPVNLKQANSNRTRAGNHLGQKLRKIDQEERDRQVVGTISNEAICALEVTKPPGKHQTFLGKPEVLYYVAGSKATVKAKDIVWSEQTLAVAWKLELVGRPVHKMDTNAVNELLGGREIVPQV